MVNEYQRKDLADDSDDDKRIRQAESRAFQKRRRLRAILQQSSVSPAVSRGPFNSTYWPRASRGFRGGSCFSCGAFGHYRNQLFEDVFISSMLWTETSTRAFNLNVNRK